MDAGRCGRRRKSSRSASSRWPTRPPPKRRRRSTSWRGIEKSILLQTLDHHWKDHLATLDALRQAIFLRAYAQKQPINEYKAGAFGLFERMLQNIRSVTRTVARIDFQFREPEPMPLPDLPDFLTTHIDPFTGEDNSADIDGGSLGVIADTLPPMQVPRPDLPEGEIPMPRWRSAATRRAWFCRAASTSTATGSFDGIGRRGRAPVRARPALRAVTRPPVARRRRYGIFPISLVA